MYVDGRISREVERQVGQDERKGKQAVDTWYGSTSEPAMLFGLMISFVYTRLPGVVDHY